MNVGTSVQPESSEQLTYPAEVNTKPCSVQLKLTIADEQKVCAEGGPAYHTVKNGSTLFMTTASENTDILLNRTQQMTLNKEGTLFIAGQLGKQLHTVPVCP